MTAGRRTADPRVVHLRAGGTSVALDLDAPGGPAIVHWGEELDDASLEGLARAARPQRVTGGLDEPTLPSLVATPAHGWLGTPVLEGHRDGTGTSVRLTLRHEWHDESHARVTLDDVESGLEATIDIEVGGAGLLRQRMTVRNLAATRYTVQAAHVIFPVPGDAVELLDTAGPWLRERGMQRHAFTIGTHLRESRRGRPGLDATLLLAAGRAGFGFESGRVHGIHVAWSGGHRVLAERTVGGDALLFGGELLAPGEIVLASGEEYATPWVVGSWGDGLTELSRRFHTELRARPGHPRRPRPVSISTWEAVYFDHDPDRLIALADAAASVGVERFVLDDGWFEGRRHDRAGLGDWRPDPAVWPDGLHPLVDRVVGHGMEFGLWVEPEMVSVDSALARQHPEWILRSRTEPPPTARGQQVLDLTRPEVSAEILGQLRALLDEYPISFLKWDHNRDLVDAGSGPGSGSLVHAQTLALYRVLDELRAEYPHLEIESCASGGGRVDLGILERTDRVWTSDSLDPIERLPIQRATGLVVPPELLGAHITSPAVHSSGRVVDLGLSAMVAMFGHLGIECDLTRLAPAELDRLREWITVAREVRGLVASGAVVHVDGADPGLDVRGVVSPSGDRAVFTIIQVASSSSAPPPRVRLPGLAGDRLYRVRPIAETPADGAGRTPLEWAVDGVVMSGRALGSAGIRPPVLAVQTGIVVEVRAVDAPV